jgi:hypothetical protein
MESMPAFLTEWRDERLAAIPASPDLLYHYTDSSGLMGILNSKELWATDALFTNDRTEVLHSLFVLRRILEGVKIDRDADPATDMMLIAAEEFYTVMQILAVSFCIDRDLLSQWRGYGQSGGYAIGFDSNLLKAVTTKDIMLAPVVYESKLQDQLTHELIERWRDLFHDVELVEFDKQVRRLGAFVFAQAFSFLAATFKSSGFREEAEWRLVYRRQLVVKDDTALTVAFRERKGMIAGYARMPLPPVTETGGPVRRIVLGPTANPNLVGFGLYQFLMSVGYSEGMVQVSPSEVTLRL